MRKIQTKSEIERRKKKNIIIISSLMLGMLLISTLGFAFLSRNPKDNSSNPNEINRENIVFLKEGKVYNLISNYNDIENISVEIEYDYNDYKNSIVYIDSKNRGIFAELAKSMMNIASRVQEACYGPCKENLPEKNCTNGKLISWKESNINKVYQKEECVFIEGDIRSADAFIYRLFGSPKV